MEPAQPLRSRAIATWRRALTGAALCCCVAACAHDAQATAGSTAAEEPAQLDSAGRDELRAIVAGQIAANRLPGAVVALGDASRVTVLASFGRRAITPLAEPMTDDTLFDLASLTKVVATTTAVLQLAERGRIDLDAPVANYWPAFGAHGKASITTRELLTHTSGLPAELAHLPRGAGAGRRALADVTPVAAAGTRMIYSDVNFAVLGELVVRVSGQSLDRWCSAHIFRPLGMTNTRFRPSAAQRARTAPTTADMSGMRRGRVHDPLAAALGGVAGNAGLFSTAADLARFAQMLLGGGERNGVRVLSAASVAALATPADAARPAPWRGLGWEIEAPFVANRDRLVPIGAIAHTGYTGTALWIDFVSRRFLVVLTNRVHPDGEGDARPIREQVRALVASTAPVRTDGDIAHRLPWTAGAIAQARQLPAANPARGTPVRTGIDVLRDERFAPLAGRRVALITNRSGFDANGTRTVDLLAHAPNLTLVALFAPEHGLATDVDAPYADTTDVATGLPVHRLYGDTRRLPPAALEGIDALVFDIQDAGVRFFTYETTLGYALEAAAARGVPIYVLDRPDPLGADRMGGPVSTNEQRFTSYFPLPLAPAMTVGELATLFNAERHLHADLHVITMAGYTRTQRFDATGLGFAPLSPNLRSLTALDLYPDVGLIEGANVSVGRGTPQPFEWIGAPWLDGARLAAAMQAAYPSARFAPIDFVPTESTWHGQLCHGVSIANAPADRVPGELGIALLVTLHALYPDRFDLAATRDALGSPAVYDAIAAGADAAAAAAIAAAETARFAPLRRTALLY